MDLSKIVSISGKSGLYLVKSQAVGRLIVESVIDGKCTPAFAHDRMSSLEEISIFSTDEDRPLKDVFKMIHEKMGDKVDFDYKKATPEQLREKFAFVMPDYDEEAIFAASPKRRLNPMHRQKRLPKKSNCFFMAFFVGSRFCGFFL